jgi:hypothetical protein
MVEESGAENVQERLSHLQRILYLGISVGMRSTSTSALGVMLMLSPLHLFIKQEARHVRSFRHSEILIRMTDETPLLLALGQICDL